jgi:hypothetical protein
MLRLTFGWICWNFALHPHTPKLIFIRAAGHIILTPAHQVMGHIWSLTNPESDSNRRPFNHVVTETTAVIFGLTIMSFLVTLFCWFVWYVLCDIIWMYSAAGRCGYEMKGPLLFGTHLQMYPFLCFNKFGQYSYLGAAVQPTSCHDVIVLSNKPTHKKRDVIPVVQP